MRAIQMRGKALGVVLALMGLLVYAAVAFADNTVADGDGVEPVGSNTLAFGNVDCDAATNKDARIAISRNGNGNVFADSAVVTITVQSVSGAGLSATAPSSTITLPSNWGGLSNNTMSASVLSQVTIDSTTEGPGLGSVTYRATGNDASSGTLIRETTMPVTWNTGSCASGDTTPPVITITSPANNASYLLGSTQLADYGCVDNESTVTQCEGNVLSGTAFDTSSVGPKSFTVNAASAGGSDSETHNYSVVYDATGLFSPIANSAKNGAPTGTNKAKAGSSVPVKFSLGGYGLLTASQLAAKSAPVSTPPAWDADAEVISGDQVVNPGSSGLSYDPIADQYTYVWKTEKSWANSSRQLLIRLNDGTEFRANFDFMK